jgi:hypothetical protein
VVLHHWSFTGGRRRKREINSEEEHPKQEREYWKSKMIRLTGISEQLRCKICRTVYDLLTQVL